VENPYVSSILTKYGDPARVKQDAATITEIISRQGSNLVLDCVAEYAGNAAIKFSFDKDARKTLMIRLTSDFKDALDERL